MSVKPENQFISSVHAHLPPPSELYRMKNNNEYTAGIADCWYSGRRDLWIEWKFLVVPARDTTVIDLVTGKKPALSFLQQSWLAQREAEGRNVWVIVGCKEGGVLFCSAKQWGAPMTAGAFRAKLMSRMNLANAITQFVQGAV